MTTTTRTLTADETALLSHVTMFGSDGYPLQKVKSGWTWGYRGVQGPPVVFRTKREAAASLEAFLAVLREANGRQAQAAAIREAIARGESIESLASRMSGLGAGNQRACAALIRETMAA